MSVTFNLVNKSAFPVSQVVCKLIIDHQAIPVTVSSIPAEATVPVSWKGKIPSSVNAVFVGIEPVPAFHIPVSEPQNILSIPWIKPDSRIVFPLLEKTVFFYSRSDSKQIRAISDSC